MELVIILAVVAFVVWYFVFRDKKTVEEAVTEAPYKVDVPPAVEPVKVEPVVEAPAEVGKSADDRVEATAPLAEPVKAKRPAKPRAAKAPAKTTAKAPAKTTAKAPAKPRAKKAPTMTVAK